MDSVYSAVFLSASPGMKMEADHEERTKCLQFNDTNHTHSGRDHRRACMGTIPRASDHAIGVSHSAASALRGSA